MSVEPSPGPAATPAGSPATPVVIRMRAPVRTAALGVAAAVAALSLIGFLSGGSSPPPGAAEGWESASPGVVTRLFSLAFASIGVYWAGRLAVIVAHRITIGPSEIRFQGLRADRRIAWDEVIELAGFPGRLLVRTVGGRYRVWAPELPPGWSESAARLRAGAFVEADAARAAFRKSVVRNVTVYMGVMVLGFVLLGWMLSWMGSRLAP